MCVEISKMIIYVRHWLRQQAWLQLAFTKESHKRHDHDSFQTDLSLINSNTQMTTLCKQEALKMCLIIVAHTLLLT